MMRTLTAVLFIWAGLLAGVSFVATPAKFLAPSLPMTQALDVGRWTFHVLSSAEAGFVAVAAVLILMAWRSDAAGIGIIAGLIGIVAVLLAAESFVLRPLLDARVLRIMAGESVPPNQSHNVYIALEAVRLVLILAAATIAIRSIEGRS